MHPRSSFSNLILQLAITPPAPTFPTRSSFPPQTRVPPTTLRRKEWHFLRRGTHTSLPRTPDNFPHLPACKARFCLLTSFILPLRFFSSVFAISFLFVFFFFPLFVISFPLDFLFPLFLFLPSFLECHSASDFSRHRQSLRHHIKKCLTSYCVPRPLNTVADINSTVDTSHTVAQTSENAFTTTATTHHPPSPLPTNAHHHPRPPHAWPQRTPHLSPPIPTSKIHY